MARKWKINLNYSSNDSKWLNNIPRPPCSDSINDNDSQSIVGGSNDAGSVLVTAEKQLELKRKQVMAMAYSPGKNLLTTAFMLWMSGSSIQIFSIMMTGMALINPLKAIISVNEFFSPFAKEEGIDVHLPKLIYLALQVLALGLALYKCSTMGLLPLTSADWTSYIPTKIIEEQSAIPI